MTLAPLPGTCQFSAATGAHVILLLITKKAAVTGPLMSFHGRGGCLLWPRACTAVALMGAAGYLQRFTDVLGSRQWWHLLCNPHPPTPSLACCPPTGSSLVWEVNCGTLSLSFASLILREPLHLRRKVWMWTLTPGLCGRPTESSRPGVQLQRLSLCSRARLLPGPSPRPPWPPAQRGSPADPPR